MTVQLPKTDKQSRRDSFHARLFDAHNRAREQARAARQNNRPRTGVTRLSNTDSLRTALAMRRRVMAKLAEVAAAIDLEPRVRGAMVATVKMQLDRIDRQIMAIRRRERAIEEERQARRDDCPRARRRRRADMKERSIFIRRDFLYSARDGGFDPKNPAGIFKTPAAAGAAVAFDLGGANVGVVMDAPSVTSNVEVTL